MLTIRKNKFLLALIFTALLGFALFTVGGEFFHRHIHHHHTEDSREQCPVYQFQTQSAITFTAILAAFALVIIGKTIIRGTQSFITRGNYLLPESHAPPVFLF